MSKGYVPGKEKCRRCGRWFTPRKNEEYGPTCARKVAALEAFHKDINERAGIEQSPETVRKMAEQEARVRTI